MFSAFAQIPSFRVMDILAQAQALEAQGRTILHLEAGQPAQTLPLTIQQLLPELVSAPVGYTASRGAPGLLQALAAWYERHSAQVREDSIAVASGSSPLLWAWLSLLLRPGDEVLVLDPGYPAYNHLSRALGASVVPIPVTPENGYVPDLEDIRSRRSSRSRLLLLGSPANPTGAAIPLDILQEAAEMFPFVLVDEIYRGLQLSGQGTPGILIDRPANCIVLDGFAKRYALPGWRLGYTVAEPDLIRALDPLLQNGLICANPLSQAVGEAILQPAYDDLPAKAAGQYRANLAQLLPGLHTGGWDVPHEPAAAFYVLASHPTCPDGNELARRMLHDYGVAVTPGGDFGHTIKHTVRFSLCSSSETVQQAATIAGEISL